MSEQGVIGGMYSHIPSHTSMIQEGPQHSDTVCVYRRAVFRFRRALIGENLGLLGYASTIRFPSSNNGARHMSQDTLHGT